MGFTSTLIEPSDLLIQIQSGLHPVILDCSFDLAHGAAGESAYVGAHLPGALYVHLERDLSGPKSAVGPRLGGRHPLPDRAHFADLVGRWGVGPDTPVVAYDAQGGAMAARAWWLLRWLGHSAVAVLNGGLIAWQQAGGPTESGPANPAGSPAPKHNAYPIEMATMPTLNADELQAQLGQLVLIDARAPERYRGDLEPLDPVAGHIPGARNRFFKNNLGPDGRFLPAQMLRAAFVSAGASDPGQVVHQCGSGVTACHNLLAMEYAGLSGSHLYPGSWSEWCGDPARAVARL